MKLENLYQKMGIEKKVYAYGQKIEEALKERFAAIDKTAEYFKAMGLPSHLEEIGIGEENFGIMAQKAASRLHGAYVDLTSEQVEQIFKDAL